MCGIVAYSIEIYNMPMNIPRVVHVILFALVLSLSIPPCFAPAPSVDIAAIYPRPGHILLCLIATLLLCFYGAQLGAWRPRDERNDATRAVSVGTSLVAFGILCVSSAIMRAVIGGGQSFQPFTLRILVCCLSAFILSACYEETVYRLYLPAAFNACMVHLPLFNKRIKGHTIASMASEASAVAVFAFAHKYSCAPSVINAAIAAIVLRMALKRSRSILSCIIVHTAYNTVQLLLINQ